MDYGPTMIYFLFKIINPATIIAVSNLKDEIQKSKLAKFGNNIKDLIDNMSSNYTNIVDKVEIPEGYALHIFKALLSGPK